MIRDRLDFPPGFLWGTATSAHQVEGGNSNNDWWAFEQQPGAIWHGDRSGQACGWWQDAEADFDLMAALGQNTHRLSVEWSRIEPREGLFDPAALARYREMLAGLRQRGIEPMVTLHHFTTPLWLARQGGWAKAIAIEHFRRFVQHTVASLSDLVRLWCTINEPEIYAAEGYWEGVHAPGRKAPLQAFAVLRNMLLAHAAAYQAIHAVQPNAQVGLVKDVRLFDAANPRSPADRFIAALIDYSFNRLVLRPLASGRLAFPLSLGLKSVPGLAESLDFFGLNYYTRDRVAFGWRPAAAVMQRFPTPGAEIGDSGRFGTYGEIYPEGLYRALQRVASLGKPIYVTEVGLPDADDDQRPRFLLTHLAQVHRAIAEGLPVKGVYYWSLLDNFEWAEGWALRFGLVSFDPVTQERRVRRSGELYAAIARENAITRQMVETYAPECCAQIFPDGRSPDGQPVSQRRCRSVAKSSSDLRMSP